MRLGTATVLVVGLLMPTNAHASCIGTTVQQTATSLGAVPSNALVVASSLETDITPLPNRGDELALRVAQLMAGKVAGAHAAPRAMTLEQARASASRASVLVYVHLQLQRSQLRVTTDIYPVIRNVWDRARLPPPAPIGHAYSAAPIDAEVRAFFPPLALELQSVHKASHGEGEVLAAACGDLDGSGVEIMLVSRERVTLGRLKNAKLDVERNAPWSLLARRTPVPLREPLAGIEISLGRANVGTSDRGAVAIDDALGMLKPMSGIPLGAGMCAALASARASFDGLLTSCEVSAPSVSGHVFDAGSAFDLVAASGAQSLAVATREGSKLHLRVGGDEKASFEGAGAQVVVLDANLDGAPEVAFSSDQSDDAITIATVGAAGARIITRIPAPGGVRALAACPPLDAGSAAVLAVVGNEVWVVR